MESQKGESTYYIAPRVSKQPARPLIAQCHKLTAPLDKFGSEIFPFLDKLINFEKKTFLEAFILN